ncbi:DMT family transporter [Roseomonas sp. BN140053]|uniref:DMT family transporter n=1 Tax=Roseomonas sp. BN140053 TaxID=3391898 RepID=UPI0039EA5871
MPNLFLLIAILAEVAATTALKLSDGFSRPLPAAVTVAGYAVAFFFLSLCLRSMPVGVAYAIWSGVGIVLVSLIGLFWFEQRLDGPAVLGMALIVAGVAVMNLFSRSTGG